MRSRAVRPVAAAARKVSTAAMRRASLAEALMLWVKTVARAGAFLGEMRARYSCRYSGENRGMISPLASAWRMASSLPDWADLAERASRASWSLAWSFWRKAT